LSELPPLLQGDGDRHVAAILHLLDGEEHTLPEAAETLRLLLGVEKHLGEPHAYHNVARAFQAVGRPALAALHYEILLAGAWQAPSADALRQAARQDYMAFLRDSLRGDLGNKNLADHFAHRLRDLAGDATPSGSPGSGR
jgi:hypothetical protein